MKEMRIGSTIIGPGQPPFIIAEISGNHNGSLENALKLVDEAKKAGVSAVKLQTYTPDTITLDIKGGNFLITNPSSPWKGRTLYELYKEAYTPWEWHDPIFMRCREWGLTYFSTPFDETAVDFLETLSVPCYKIGSPEIIDIPLIKKVAATGKPLFLSTGGASIDEINDAVEAARQTGNNAIVLMKCTMAYPAQPAEMNLRTLPDLEKRFGTLVGLSDHTLGTGVSVASIPLGACAIEKHLTFSRADGGVDSMFSLEPSEFKDLVVECHQAWEALGTVHYGPLPREQSSYSHRPSLYFVSDLPKGAVVTAENIRTLRPQGGLEPKQYDSVIGKRLKQAVNVGMPVSWNLIEMD